MNDLKYRQTITRQTMTRRDRRTGVGPIVKPPVKPVRAYALILTTNHSRRVLADQVYEVHVRLLEIYAV